MADERKIVIELKVSGGTGDESTSAEKENNRMTNDLVKKLKAVQHPFATMENSLLQKATLGKTEYAQYVLSKTKALAKNAILYNLNKYFNLAEDYKAEQTLNNTLNVLSHIGEGFTSILGGAIAGAKTGAGVPGAVVGALTGATFWVADTALNTYKAFDQENISLSTMRIQAGYQKVRLGLVDDGRGTQN